MIILLSPAKTLDYETPSINIPHTIPNLLSNSKKLIKNLKEKKPEEISNLYGSIISKGLSKPYRPDNNRR